MPLVVAARVDGEVVADHELVLFVVVPLDGGLERLHVLDGEEVETAEDASQPNTVLLDPVLADNVSDDGRETLESWQVDGLDPLWPLGLQIEGWTSYEPEQAIDCEGP